MNGGHATGAPDPNAGVTTLGELAVHLREAGAERVFLPKPEAFREGAVAVVVTYSHDNSAAREVLMDVVESIGDRVWFEGSEWTLDPRVEPAFREPPAEFATLYDRGVERTYGDGFDLRVVRFVYEQYAGRERE